jgi:predicted DCC family thiol-disulfide oxidoreductase YuxK
MNDNYSLLLFDGVCNLCNRVVNFVIRRAKSKKIKFAPLQSEVAAELLLRYNIDTVKTDSVIYFTGGKAYIKSSAVLHLLKDIGRGWKIFYGFIIIPAFILDFFYDLIAKNRYRLFGRREMCMVPSKELKDFFLNSK